MDDRVTRTALQETAEDRFVPLRRQLGVTTLGLNQIVLEAGERGRIHRHWQQEEVYLVLDGTLSLVIEGEEIELGAGELIRVPAELRRQLVNRGPGPLSLLALGGMGEHEGRDGEAYATWDETEGKPPREIPLPADLPDAERRS
jgi:mannose-6-phosphate isomerase-like protein (cupin superfamily)